MKKACYAEHFAGFFLSLCWLNYIMLPGDGQERPGIPGTASAVRSSGGQEAANVSDLHGCHDIGAPGTKSGRLLRSLLNICLLNRRKDAATAAHHQHPGPAAPARPAARHRLPPREAAARHAWHKENRRDDLHAPDPSSRKEDRTTTKTMPGMTTASPGLASAASHHHARPSRPGLASSLCHRLHGPFSGRHFKRGHFSDRPRLFSLSNLFPFPLYRVFVYRLYDLS